MIAFHKSLLLQIGLWLAAGLTANMIASMGKGRHISMETLTKFCEAMNCGIRCD